MSINQNYKKTNFRWVMCALLFVATTVNYMDRQVLSLTWKDFIAPEFHWTNEHYGEITAWFSLLYAGCMLFAGRFVDWMGTKKGFLWAIGVWSAGACLHAACGWATMQVEGLSSVAEMTAATGAIAVSIATVSVWFFIAARFILALGEAGNFPAAIKTTAEYFPKKDRAFATSVFNAGASVGALAAPATIPLLAQYFKDLGYGGGWEMAFIIIGGLGFIWMFFWVFLYSKPQDSKYVNKAELEYIEQDKDDEPVQAEGAPERKLSFMECFKFKQTWAFAIGKFFTDGVWWFYLFWAPAYFSEQYGYASSSSTGIWLIILLYAIVTVLSLYGGYLPKLFVERQGMNPYAGRMRAMLIFAFLPLPALLAQWAGSHWVWWAAIIIGLAGAGHQAWSANLFSTIGDMFPKSAIATITGIGGMAGGIGSFLINKGAGWLFDYSAGYFTYTKVVNGSTEVIQEVLNRDNVARAFDLAKDTFEPGCDPSILVQKVIECGGEIVQAPMEAMFFSGAQSGYMIVFCICAVAYLVAWSIMKTLVPKYKPIVVR